MWQQHADNPLLSLVSLMDHTPGQRQFVDIPTYRHYYQDKHGFSESEMDDFILQKQHEAELYSARHRQIIAEAVPAEKPVLSQP